jgi:flagellin
MVTISSNPSAGAAALNLDKAQRNLMSSLAKLSSGKRIVNPYDDAGGEAVQLKLKAAVTRYGTAKNNIMNAVSFLQVQDGVLQTATEIVGRIADLRTMADDSSKGTADIANYNEEYLVLKTQLSNLDTEQFNSVALFGAGTERTVFTSEQGSAGPSITLNAATQGITDTGGASNIQAATGLTDTATSTITADLQALANMRAKNGALQSVMNYAYDNAAIGKTNLEAARGRIVDLDIAEESTKFARANLLAQAASSMLAQANASQSSTLRALLG